MQVINSHASHFNMTELALLTFAHKLDYNTIEAKADGVLKVIPFNSMVKRSAAIVALPGNKMRVLVNYMPLGRFVYNNVWRCPTSRAD